jgi:hypothetical protein
MQTGCQGDARPAQRLAAPENPSLSRTGGVFARPGFAGPFQEQASSAVLASVSCTRPVQAGANVVRRDGRVRDSAARHG